MDVEKLERLARYVNSVSVQEDSVRRWVDEEGVERVMMLVSSYTTSYRGTIKSHRGFGQATWVNPKFQEDRPLVGSGH